MKFILAFLFLSFQYITLFAQAVPIKEIDFMPLDYNSPITGRVGDKLLFSQAYRPLWETDGTAIGTKRLTANPIKNIAFYQISNDSLIIAHFLNDNAGFDIFLYTSTMNQPKKITTIDGSSEYTFKSLKVGNQFIVKTHTNLIIIDLQTLIFKQFNGPELKDITLDLVALKNKIYFGNKLHFYSIDLSTQKLVEIEKNYYGVPFLSCLTSSKDKLLIGQSYYNKNTWSFDGQKFTKVEGIKTFPNPQLSVNNRLIYFQKEPTTDSTNTSLYATDGTNEDIVLLKENLTTSLLNISNASYNKIVLNNKLYFFAGASELWETNGTKSGTKLYKNNQDINILSILEKHKLGAIVIGKNKDHILCTYLLDGTENLILLKENYAIKYGPYIGNISNAFIGDSLIYLRLINIDYGRELHRYNRFTKKIELVSDHDTYASWSHVKMLGLTKKYFFYTYNTDDKTMLFAVPNNTKIPPIKAKEKEDIKWTEQIGRSNINSTTDFYSTFLDKDDNSIIAFSSINHFFEKTFSNAINIFNNNKTIKKSSYLYHLVKLDKEGKLLWSKNIPAQYENEHGAQSKCDSKGNIITATILPQSIKAFEGHQIQFSKGSLLVLKHSPEGKLLWLKQAQISKSGRIHKISIDNKDQILLAGKFSGASANFDNNTIYSERSPTTFIAKYSDEGKALWAKDFPLPYFMPADIGDIKLSTDKNNNIIFTQRIGKEQNKACSDSQSKYRFIINSIASNDGLTRWSNIYEGTDFCYPADIATSPFGNIYIIGGYNDRIKFDEFQLSSGSCGQSNRFLLQLNSIDGSTLRARKLDYGREILSQLVFEKNGNWCIVGHNEKKGYFGKVSPFDSIALSYISKEWVYEQIFIDKYNQLGELINQETFSQNTNLQRMSGRLQRNIKPVLNFASDGDWIVSFANTAPVDSFNITYFGEDYRIFTTKFTPKKDLKSYAVDDKIDKDDIRLTPNPATSTVQIQSVDLDFTKATVNIYAMDGKQWLPPIEHNNGFIQLDIKELPKGIYVVAIQLADQVVEKRLVKY